MREKEVSGPSYQGDIHRTSSTERSGNEWRDFVQLISISLAHSFFLSLSVCLSVSPSLSPCIPI